MNCPVCMLMCDINDAIQFIPCLHIICYRCFEVMGNHCKTCPFPYCFSPLRQQPDLRLNKCQSPVCRRRIAPVGEQFILDCEHSLCGECYGELFRGRFAAYCPECDQPVAAEGEESCDVCARFSAADQHVISVCCGAKICSYCAEKGNRDREEREQDDQPGGSKEAKKDNDKDAVHCPEGKCPIPKKRKKKGKEADGATGPARCSCGLACENEPLPNFPSAGECKHEVCLECLGKCMETNEIGKQVPCCPNEMCRQPYRSESVLALRVLFPERKKYFDMFEVGFHYGFEKLRDEMMTEVEHDDDFDMKKRLFRIQACLTEGEDDAIIMEFDRKGTFGDLLREARRALNIGTTVKVYGYYLRIHGEDKVIVISQDMIQQDLETAGVLSATMVMVDLNGIVSANKHFVEPVKSRK